MKDNPFGQSMQLMQLAKDQGLSEGDVQKLFSFPLLSHLFRAAKELDISKVDLAEFRRVLGYDDRDEFEVSMSPLHGFTSEIAAYLRREGCAVHELINDEMFLLQHVNSRNFHMKLMELGGEFKFQYACDMLNMSGRHRPTYAEALFFAYQYGAEIQISDARPLIMFLHEPVLDAAKRARMLVLHRSSRGRKLDLDYAYGDHAYSYNKCVLAGVIPEVPA